MSRLGFGFGSTTRPPPTLWGAAFGPRLAIVEPSASWDGTVGSGFSTVPTDPLRATAKPICRLLVPPRQWFTDRLTVGVAAYALHEGGLMDNCGLEKVVIHFEGESADIVAPSFASFMDVNDNPVTYFGWWAELKKPAGMVGSGHVYFEAIAKDPTMQRRVVGPFIFCPQDTLHDGSLTVAVSSGADFTNLDDATNFAKAQGWQNPLITIVEADKYEMAADNDPSYSDQNGYFNITASVPGVSIGVVTTAPGERIRNNKGRLHFFGENLTIDMNGVIEIAGSTGPDTHGLHWLDGITFTSTHPDEEFELLHGEKIDQFGWRVERNCWFTECTISKLAGSTGGASLVRGCTWEQITYDICATVKCAIDSQVFSHSDTFWGEDHAVFTATYTGAEATATLERTGGTGGNDIYYTARWGANSATFHTGDYYYWQSGSGDGYSVQHVVDWLNTLPGWTAAANNATVAGYIAGRVSAEEGGSSGSFPSGVDVKDTVHQFYIQWSRHSDFYQIAGAPTENQIITGNVVDQAKVQSIFLGPAGGGDMMDIVIANNIFHMSNDEQGSYSQVGKGNCDFSHLIIAHNSWVNQKLGYRFDTGTMTVDSYSLLANNTLTELGYGGGDAPAANNHLHEGAVAPSNATDTTIGGTKVTLFADANGGDFTPAGQLLANPRVPILPFDRNHQERGAIDAVGALRGIIITPDTFTFTAVTEAEVDTAYISDAVTISGMSATGEVIVTDGEIRVNGGSWTSSITAISNGDKLEVRVTSSASGEVAVVATVSIGTVSADYSVTTKSVANPMSGFAATLGFWDYTRQQDMTAGDGGAVVQGDADSVALVPDQMGTFDLEQTNAALRPTYDNGIFHSSSLQDRMQMPLAATKPGNAALVFIQKGTRGNTDLLVNFASTARVRAQLGSATAVSPQTSVNGVVQATRNDLATAVSTGVANVILIDGVNMGAWSGMEVGGNSSGYLTAGHYMLVAMLDKDAADYADALAYAIGNEAPRQIAQLGL